MVSGCLTYCPLAGAFSFFALIGFVYLLLLSMILFKLNPTASVQARNTQATTVDGGVYTIAEFALVDRVADKEYVTSIGASYRRDEMSEDVRKIRDGIHAARRNAEKQLDEASTKQLVEDGRIATAAGVAVDATPEVVALAN